MPLFSVMSKRGAAYYRHRYEQRQAQVKTEESYVSLYESCYKQLTLPAIDEEYEKRNLTENAFFITACREYAIEKGIDVLDLMEYLTEDLSGKPRSEQNRRSGLKLRLNKNARKNLISSKKYLLTRLLNPHFLLYDQNGEFTQPVRKNK